MRNIKLALLAGAAAFTVMRSAGASIIYLQNFSATSGNGGQPLSLVNWSAYYGNAGTAATVAPTGSTGTPANAMLSGGGSAPTPGSNVNATAAVTATNFGFVPLLSSNGVEQFVTFSNAGEFTIDRTANSLTSFSWYAASAYTGDQQRLIVQIDGNWYASTSPISPPAPVAGNSINTGAQKFTTAFSTSPSAWETLNFSPGSDLTLGSPLTLSLPADNITSFGIYAQIADNTGTANNLPITNERTYFDTFEVDATPVPEPAMGVMLCAIGALTLRRKVAR